MSYATSDGKLFAFGSINWTNRRESQVALYALWNRPESINERGSLVFISEQLHIDRHKLDYCQNVS